jgi:hypothetical protein
MMEEMRTLLGGLVLYLCACSQSGLPATGDGGAAAADLKSTGCNDLRRQVQTYLADFANQKCTLSSECTNTNTACGLQGVCGVALNNASLPGLTTLLMQWSSLGCADGEACPKCATPSAATCTSGVCVPQ